MSDITAFFNYYVTILLLGLAVWPIISRSFNFFPDNGWIVSKSFGLLLVSYVTWLLGMTHLVSFSLMNVQIILILVACISWCWFIFSQRKQLQTYFAGLKLAHLNTPTFKLIIIEESLFIALFIFWTIVRAYNPDIFKIEKYMDY
ncbi:hypothetical protein KC571_04225, partial [candidate division WWE3 bacterium]|nr:hypothetical protein [candidate division WWE3 bacterium]